MRIPLFPPPPKEGAMVLRNPFKTGIIAFLDTLARSSSTLRRAVQYPVARLTRLASEYPYPLLISLHRRMTRYLDRRVGNALGSPVCTPKGSKIWQYGGQGHRSLSRHCR